MLCSSCGVTNPPGSRFCMTCGRPLDPETEQEIGARPDDGGPEAPTAIADEGTDAVSPEPDDDEAPPSATPVGATPSAEWTPPQPPQEPPPPPPPPDPPSPPSPASQPPAAASWQSSDPYGLAGAASRLAPEARDAARTALIVCAAVLLDAEQVAAVAYGTIDGVPGVVALTDRRVLAVNQRDWAPLVASFAVDRQLGVQGWEDERSATLVLQAGHYAVTLAGILDRPPAYDLAARIRARTGA